MKVKIFELNKEKQRKKGKEINGDNCVGTEQQQQQQQQQSIDIVEGNKSDLEHHLKFENKRDKIRDKIKGKEMNFENRSDIGQKEKEYEKNNDEEKVNSKRKVEEKGKEKGRAKESTDDVSKESDRHSHREVEKEKDRDRDRDRLSLAGAVLGRRDPASSGIASKPRLEQVFLALSYLFFSLTILLLSNPLFKFKFPFFPVIAFYFSVCFPFPLSFCLVVLSI